MAHNNTILRQIVAFLPRHEFESLAKDHHWGQKFRFFTRWIQFMVSSSGSKFNCMNSFAEHPDGGVGLLLRFRNTIVNRWRACIFLSRAIVS